MTKFNYLIDGLKDLLLFNSFADYFYFFILIFLLLYILFFVFLLISLILEEIYYLIDTIGRPLNSGSGEIISKSAFRNKIILVAGRGNLTLHSYILNVKIQKFEIGTDVSQKIYREAREGQRINVDYIIGRRSKEIYIRRVF